MNAFLLRISRKIRQIEVKKYASLFYCKNLLSNDLTKKSNESCLHFTIWFCIDFTKSVIYWSENNQTNCNVVYCLQCGKMKNLLLPKKKKFRQIISLVFSLVIKMFLSRNFCQKSVTVNFRNFHTVLFRVSN